MPKVVIHPHHGGFQLPEDIIKTLYDLGDEHIELREGELEDTHWDIENNGKSIRRCRLLIGVVEAVKNKDGRLSDLSVVEIPDDIEWTIEVHAGKEWIAENIGHGGE